MTLETSLLPGVIGVVAEASTMLVEESRRPAGPRGAGDKAEIDVEIERYLADRLTTLLPARFVGEETPARPGDGSPFCWLVDPHDGTWAWLEGVRGSAVSVALLRDGVPVLGVICAPMSPDRGRDLIAWAEGLPHLLRNGKEVKVDLTRAAVKAGSIVFLNHRAAMTPVASGAAVAPARFVSLPSIAYRLARVAAGDGVAAVSLNAPAGSTTPPVTPCCGAPAVCCSTKRGRKSPTARTARAMLCGVSAVRPRPPANWPRDRGRALRGESRRARGSRCRGREPSMTGCSTAPRAASSAR